MSLSIVKPSKIDSGNLYSNVLLPDYLISEFLWDSGENYAIGRTVLSSTADPFSPVANSPGIYRALLGGVRATNPENDPVGWEYVSVANRYLMFDYDTSQPTIKFSGDLVTIITLTGAVSVLGLYGLAADSVQVRYIDSSTNVIMDKVYSLRRPPLLANYYNYFFDDIQNSTELLVRLPLYRNGVLEVTISGTGTIKCGRMVVGKEDLVTEDIEFGATMGISDYSGKQKSAVFGADKFIRRGYSDKVDFTFRINNSSTTAVKQYLTDLRAMPSIYIMDGITSVFGFYQDFKINIPYAVESVGTLSLEGLTQ